MSNVAILSYDQYKQFRSSGKIPEFFINDEQIPAFAFEGQKRKWSSKEWKLFPKNVSKEDLLYLYERCDIAANAVDTLPADVWGKGFTVKVVNEEGEEVKDSPLEQKIWEINQKHKVRAVFQEAHRYARLFGLGIVVIGLADGKSLDNPVKPPVQDVSYLTAFSSYEITKIEFNKDLNSEDYGKIERYKIVIKGEQKQEFWVHASRVIHIMEKTIGKSAWGKSVLEPCYDLFIVLKNTDWSAGESYYQNASPIFIVTWEDIKEVEVEPPSKEEIDAIKEDIKDIHVRKRFVLPASWHVEVVKGSGQLPDPGKIWQPVIERIAGGVKIPKQLLLGTSAGALASSETNLKQYFKYVANMQSTFAEPLLVDFYTRLQEWGILPEGRFDIEWTPLMEMSEKDLAEINLTKMKTASLALGDPMKGIPALMSVEEAREQFLGLNPQIGGGRLPTLKTEASREEDHITVLDFSVEALQRQLQHLVEEARNGYSVERVIERAEDLIAHHVNLARLNAKRYIERRLGHSIPELSSEQEQRFADLERQYLADFKKILKDALKKK